MDSFTPINPKLIDARSPQVGPHDGYPDEIKAGDTPDVLLEACGAAGREFPQALYIDPSNWADKARDNDKYHTWPMNYVDRFTNQSPTHECTCHALRTVAETARNKQRGIIFPDGPKADFRYEQSAKGSVWLSPLSIYSEANPRQWGGAGCQQVLNIACNRGFLPEKIQPANYGFKHDLVGTTGKGGKNQSHGSWVRLGDFPSGWQETAKYFKPQEVIICDRFEQVVSLVLHGYAVEVGRSGHAIPYAFWNVQ
ncbi:MAG TPA: hypothetical protein VFV87_14330, partial [Pirellulaceae bacterium]|nr:hypothetical protein [Pirellulaceae bacterium]